jgi:hypothetical protein
MRGRERARKKLITRAGWRIIAERKDQERGAHSLRLRSPTGDEVEIGASSRPRAYLAAEATIFARERQKGAEAVAAPSAAG